MNTERPFGPGDNGVNILVDKNINYLSRIHGFRQGLKSKISEALRRTNSIGSSITTVEQSCHELMVGAIKKESTQSHESASFREDHLHSHQIPTHLGGQPTTPSFLQRLRFLRLPPPPMRRREVHRRCQTCSPPHEESRLPLSQSQQQAR